MKTPLMPTPRVFRETLPGIDSLRQDVDLWLNSLGRSWIPALDVYEKDGEMVFRLDLPGLEKSDVKVAVKDDVLMIDGERKVESGVKENEYLCHETPSGSFRRRISLPNPVEEYEVKATFRNRILEIRLPVGIETEGPKEVPIR